VAFAELSSLEKQMEKCYTSKNAAKKTADFRPQKILNNFESEKY